MTRTDRARFIAPHLARLRVLSLKVPVASGGLSSSLKCRTALRVANGNMTGARVPKLVGSLQTAGSSEAVITPTRHDQMVKHFNVEHLTSSNHCVGELYVLRAWVGAAGRVVVGNYDAA